MTFSEIPDGKHCVFRGFCWKTLCFPSFQEEYSKFQKGIFGKRQVSSSKKSKTSGKFCLLRFYVTFSAFSHRKRWFFTVVYRILEVLHAFSSVSETGESQHFPENVGVGKAGCAVKRRENVSFLHVFRDVLLK